MNYSRREICLKNGYRMSKQDTKIILKFDKSHITCCNIVFFSPIIIITCRNGQFLFCCAILTLFLVFFCILHPCQIKTYYHEPNIFCVKGLNLTFRVSNFKPLLELINFKIYYRFHQINTSVPTKNCNENINRK